MSTSTVSTSSVTPPPAAATAVSTSSVSTAMAASVAGDGAAQGGGNPNPLSRKLNKILETRLDNDKDMLDALRALSEFFTDNSLRSRRSLRGDIERRSLGVNEQFVSGFRDVKEDLDSIISDVQAMASCCQDMTSRIKATKEETRDLIGKTTKLQAEMQRLGVRARVADAFLSRFQLTADEVRILRGSRDSSITMEFFDVLARVKCIHNDVKVLLRTNQQTAGLEIMEQMALHQEAAYERLYRWAQGECRGMTHDSCDVASVLAHAVGALQERPVLLKYTLDEFGTGRRSAVVRGFIDALTRGGPGGTPRPIEMHSHDPLRYVGDMLAWLHQASASEREHLDALLKDITTPGTGEMVQEMLGHITEGVCRPLKVRIEQVILAEPGAVLLFKVSNLLKFYIQTIGAVVGSQDASLVVTLVEAADLSRTMFYSSLSTHAAKMLDKVECPPGDLSPPVVVAQTLSLLRDLLTSHDASVVPLDARQADFQQVVSCLLDPLLSVCSMCASSLAAVPMAVFLINSLYAMRGALAPHEFTEQRLDLLQLQIEAHLDTLVNEQASLMLTRAGMAAVYSRVQQHRPEQGPLSQIPGMDESSVKGAMVQFSRYLSSPDSHTLPQLQMLHSSSLKEVVCARAAALVSAAYAEVYEAVHRRDNRYGDAVTAATMQPTPQQVQALLM